jgi:DNA-binding XRE family transcriptional regulator
MRKYKEELSKTVEISRQSILVALDKILLNVVD